MRAVLRLTALAATAAWVASCASAKPAAYRRDDGAAPADADAAPAAAPADAAARPAESPDSEPRAPTTPTADVPDFDSLQVLKGERLQESMFQHYGTNPTVDTAEDPVSTFSVDADTASYAMARAMIERGALPDPAAIRVEEMVNALRYDYAPPTSAGTPFSVVAEAFPSPNRKGYHVLLLGLRGRVIEEKARPPANLVFVVDVSGSMEAGNRLELVKKALGVLVEELREDDTVAIVVYGDSARIVLPTASGAEKERIKKALALLKPEGSTNVHAGIMLGYEVAERAARPARDGRPASANRIILCSDGVANSGITDADGIFRTVSQRAQDGIALSTVGFGMDNYNDVLMERLAVKGQGRYAYVDRLAEARKVFVENLGGALVTIARDVKVQLHLDPDAVQRYRLLGYENRKLMRRDFDDDKVDAGEIGAGHEVTALYEVKLKQGADRLGWLRIRAKAPTAGDGDRDGSKLIEEELTTRLVRNDLSSASPLSRLALVAAGFGEKLRGSYWARNLSWDDVHALWRSLPGDLRERPDVAELGALIVRAKQLDARGDRFEREEPVATMDFDNLPILRNAGGG